MKSLIGAIYFLCATAILLALAGSTGCAPTLSAQSAAPPGRSARLDEVRGFWGNTKYYRLELSTGVALAITCTSGGPCEKMTIVSDDRQVAEVRTASLSKLEPNGISGNQATAAGLVVVGKAPGTTKLHLRSKHGAREIEVKIVAPPEPSAPARVAN